MDIDKRLRSIEDKLKNLVRVGVVSEINPAKAMARVYFDEKDSRVSTELFVLNRQTFANKDYQMPDIGEHVLCVFLENGLESGFIVGALYSAKDAPPENNPDKRVIKFKDGTRIEYDRKASVLTIDCVGDIVVNNAKTITVNSRGAVSVTAPTVTINSETANNGNVSINGNLNVSGLTTTGSLSSNGKAGGVTFVGDVSANGVNIGSSHTHQGDSGGVTGGPQ